jgi:thiol-disulfide isomerase/thioredoxin
MITNKLYFSGCELRNSNSPSEFSGPLKSWILIFAIGFISFANLQAQKISIIKLPDLQQRYLRDNDTTYLINFWATWCGPCVQEMPGFEKLNGLYRDKKFKMLLVSLDFKKDLNKLEKFVSMHKLTGQVMLLDEPKYNEWLDKIDPDWGGAIPTTLIFQGAGKKALYEKPLTFEELQSIIKPLIKQ